MTRRPFRVWVLMGLAAAVNRLAGWVERAGFALDDLTGRLDRWAGTCSECGAWHPDTFDAPEFVDEVIDEAIAPPHRCGPDLDVGIEWACQPTPCDRPDECPLRPL